jgi:hypothetical protein
VDYQTIPRYTQFQSHYDHYPDIDGTTLESLHLVAFRASLYNDHPNQSSPEVRPDYQKIPET